MAKRKKGGKKKTVKRSGKRVRGAAGMDALMMVLGALAGGIGTAFANSKVTFLQNKWVAGIETILGGVIVWKVAHPFVRGVGVGMAVTGGTGTLKGFGVLTGIPYRRFPQAQPVNGFRNVPKIGNPNIPGRQFPSPGSVGRSRDMTYAGVYTN